MLLSDVTTQNELRLTVGPSRGALILALFAIIIFFVCAILMALDGHKMGWLCAAFLVCVFPIMVGNLRRGVRTLHLNHEGFVVEGGKSPRIMWREVQGFSVAAAGQPNSESAPGLALTAAIAFAPGAGAKGGKFVVFNFVPGYSQNQKSRKVARDLFGHESSLPQVQGHKPEAVAALMNEWKNVHS